MSTGAPDNVTQALGLLQAMPDQPPQVSSMIASASKLLETEAEARKEAQGGGAEQDAHPDDQGFTFTPATHSDCEICNRGPLKFVQNLRQLEVTQAQRTQEWYEARKQCVTASELASVLGQNPYCSKAKTLRLKLGVEQSNYTSASCQHGIDNEDRAIQMYERRTGHRVLAYGLLRSQVEGQSHLAGSPDGITCCGRLIEVKCPASRKIIPGVIPKYYLPQIELLMHITGIRVTDFIQLGVTQRHLDITAAPRTHKYYEDVVRDKVNKFVELLQNARDDDTVLEQYRPRPRQKKLDFSKTFEAGFILD